MDTRRTSTVPARPRRETTNRRIGLALLLLALVAALPPATGCRRGETPDRPIRVVVSIPPLVGLVEPLLPEGAEVLSLVESGRSVHGFEPTPADIAELARADVVVLVGLGLEGRLEDAARHAGSDATVVTMANLLQIEGGDHAHDHTGHPEEPGDEHDHGSVDPHLWLDPVLARDFVLALPQRFPDVFDASAAGALAAKLTVTDESFRQRLAPYAGRSIITHHASFGRVADRYGLEVGAVLRAVETVEPSAEDIARARRAIDETGAGVVFVEPQFSGTSAERLAESAGVEIVVLDPLGSGDWFATMEMNLDRLIAGLSQARAPQP